MTQVIQTTAKSATETRKARRAAVKGLRGTLLRALGQDERGAAAVEFAFIMPILLVMFSGILQFGSVMFLENHMTNVARGASRPVAGGGLCAAAPAPTPTGPNAARRGTPRAPSATAPTPTTPPTITFTKRSTREHPATARCA